MIANPKVSPLNNSGFTLVEMLMAMLVMTVGLLGLLQSVNVAYRHSQRDTLRKEATLLAEARMHDWCSRRFGDINCSESLEEQDEKLIAGAPWHFTVIKKAWKEGANTKKLQVKVTWTIKGEPCSHEIVTLRTKRGGE
jgi:type IV pilus assembly protein PilV